MKFVVISHATPTVQTVQPERGRRRVAPSPTAVSTVLEDNELGSADFYLAL
jgi:hypothetical protein